MKVNTVWEECHKTTSSDNGCQIGVCPCQHTTTLSSLQVFHFSVSADK